MKRMSDLPDLGVHGKKLRTCAISDPKLDDAVVPRQDVINQPDQTTHKKLECNICLTEAEGVDPELGPVQFTPCFHAFHRLCIFTWVREKYQYHNALLNLSDEPLFIPCPTCKANINDLLDVIQPAFLHQPIRLAGVYHEDENDDSDNEHDAQSDYAAQRDRLHRIWNQALGNGSRGRFVDGYHDAMNSVIQLIIPPSQIPQAAQPGHSDQHRGTVHNIDDVSNLPFPISPSQIPPAARPGRADQSQGSAHGPRAPNANHTAGRRVLYVPRRRAANLGFGRNNNPSQQSEQASSNPTEQRRVFSWPGRNHEHEIPIYDDEDDDDNLSSQPEQVSTEPSEPEWLANSSGDGARNPTEYPDDLMQFVERLRSSFGAQDIQITQLDDIDDRASGRDDAPHFNMTPLAEYTYDEFYRLLGQQFEPPQQPTIPSEDESAPHDKQDEQDGQNAQ